MSNQYKVILTLASNFKDYSESTIMLILRKKIEYNGDSIELKIKDIEVTRIDSIEYEGQ